MSEVCSPSTSQKRLRRVFDDGDHALVSRVFVEVDRRAHAQRQHDHQRREDDIERAQNVRQNADFSRQIAGLRAQQLPADVWQALAEHIDDQKQHQRARQSRRDIHERAHQADIGPAPPGNPCFFHFSPSCRA